jgi:phage/plasmid-like protein (TIGR03299 family)
MAHEIESIVYKGETPWHGLGERITTEDPAEWYVESKCNWEVAKVQAYVKDSSQKDGLQKIPTCALFRSSDRSLLSVVPQDWHVVQNSEVFKFFERFTRAGQMEMHTAGSLKQGKCIWALAKLKDSIDLFRGDVTESYLLLSSFHMYGFSTDIRFTPIRVVCNNTLQMALAGEGKHSLKIPHKVRFDVEAAQDTVDVARKQLEAYKEQAEFLGSRRAEPGDEQAYLMKLFPATEGSKKADNDNLSRSAYRALRLVEAQPGADFAAGSWWQTYNAVTYLIDHEYGRSADSRLWSAWYGQNQRKKVQALNLAVRAANDSRPLLRVA